MTTHPAIRVDGLLKRHGEVTALDEVSFDVRPGTVTAFLGPNGAGKSSALRVIAGVDRPTSGRVEVLGRPLVGWESPGHVLGAALSTDVAHGGRTARASVRWVGRLLGRTPAECDDALERVGLAAVAGRRTKGFSLGMRQRLSLAVALLGDPEVLLLDEPMNGLDPEGIAWTRQLLADLRARGRTVFFSTHLLAEVEDVVDDVVVIAAGRVVDTGPADAFLDRHQQQEVTVRCSDPQRLAGAVQAVGGWVVKVDPVGRMQLGGVSADRVGALAGEHTITVLELSTGRSLHGAFEALTRSLHDTAGGPVAPRTLEGAHR